MVGRFLVKSFLADRRLKRAERKQGRFECSRRWTHACGALCVLALAGTAGALILERSYALAQGRPAAQRASVPGGDVNIENGKTVFSSQQCETCHGNQGQGGVGAAAGPLIAGPSMTLAMFIESVRNAPVPMPAYSASQVSDAALSDVYAFLKSMAPTVQTSMVTAAAGNAENGKRLFVSAGCDSCHNGDGQGGGNAPRLAPNPNMMAFAAFVQACREPDRMPPYTSKVLSDAQLADIYAFLQTVPKPPDVSSIPLLQ